MKVTGWSPISSGFMLLAVGLLMVVGASLFAWVVRIAGVLMMIVAVPLVISGLFRR